MSLANKIQLIARNLISDDRGWFLKVINGTEKGLPEYTGEIYLTNASIGQAKGGHYHNKASEWFTLLTGQCTVYLLDIDTNEKLEYKLNPKKPVTLFVPPGIAHIFVNTGNTDFILLAYTDELYNPEDTIPFNFSDI